MSPNIYLVDESRGLVEMREQPYDSEAVLQRLLADYPALLAGEQSGANGAPQRWALIRREAAVPEQRDGHGRWALDHLFVDTAGVPTLVEVKRSSDTRLRREVIGQMLDYAAHAVTSWTEASVRADFEATCEASGIEPDIAICDLMGDGDADVDLFWVRVRRNLEAGRIRMVFVADDIPREVRRVVEFLNEQMSPAEVLAIEVKQFIDPIHGFQTLVPRPVGQSVRSQAKKVDPDVWRARQWDRDTVLGAIEERQGTNAREIASRLIRWAQSEGLREGFIGGPNKGAMYFELAARPDPVRFLFVHSTGGLGVAFDRLKQAEPFTSDDARKEIAMMLERIEGVRIKNIAGGPQVPLALLGTEEALERFVEVVRLVKRRLGGDASGEG